MFFQTHKGSLQVFRYCSIFKVLCASVFRPATCLFYHRSGFLSSLFFEAFELSELGPLKSFSEQTGACRGETPPFPYGNRSATQTPHWGVCCFATAEQLSVYWFFSHASCRPQEVILFVRRLALKYNTIPPPLCQHFLITFLKIFPVFPVLPRFAVSIQKKDRPYSTVRTVFVIESDSILYIVSRAQRISMPSLNFRLPRIFLTTRSTSSAEISFFGSDRDRVNAMLFLPSPRFAPR